MERVFFWFFSCCSQILSPGAVKTHMKEFWEHEKMFDAILALTITCKLLLMIEISIVTLFNQG